MSNITNGGPISREMSVPAKLILNGKEIDVMVKMIEEHTTDKIYYYDKETKKFADVKRHITRVYMCEEHVT